jgi:hypothetical protein
MPAKSRPTASADDELLRKLAKEAEAEDAEAEDAEEGKRAAEATTSDPDDDDDDDGEDGDKDKRRTKRAEAKKGRKGDHYMKKAKDKDPDDDSDDDSDDGDDEDDDEKDDEKKGRSAEAVRIMQLCNLAKCPERALEFVQRGYSVDRVIRALGSKRADDNNAPERSTNSFAPVRTTALQQMMNTAKNLAASKGVPIGKAYEQMLKANPSAYAAYCQEKLDATAAGPGTSMAKAYSEHIQRLLAMENGGPVELLLKTNVGDAAGR